MCLSLDVKHTNTKGNQELLTPIIQTIRLTKCTIIYLIMHFNQEVKWIAFANVKDPDGRMVTKTKVGDKNDNRKQIAKLSPSEIILQRCKCKNKMEVCC
jgi:hypothetical protein